ncbi:MAG: biotin/lipoyl-containing protein [Bacteroidota bacterium]
MKTIKLSIQGNPYEVTIRSISGNIADVVVNGIPYKVEIDPKSNISANTVISTPNPVLAPITEKPAETKMEAAPVQEVPADLPAGSHKLVAPLPGIIIGIDVKPGDKVKMGQKLLVLEAMKMENNINSDKDGTITKICVTKGDSVMEGDVMIEMGG